MVEYGKEPNSPLRHKTENNELKKAWLGIDFGIQTVLWHIDLKNLMNHKATLLKIEEYLF